jgi:hypothetical protein
LLADMANNEEEDIDNKEEENIDNKEDNIDNKEEDVEDDVEENKDAVNNMHQKLKQAAATTPKKTIKKELGMEKLASNISKKLKISTPV